MLFHIFAEERGVGETEAVTDLLDAQVGLLEIVADILQHMLLNPFVGGSARVLLANDGEILGRDAKLAGVCLDRTVFHFTGMEQGEEAL